ncbi:probable cyclin-dependent serine/threonine-protein kinase DDB_G0292550 [Pecten maximus]|uniref:probable cyclin-dependent serine/threonine-protein kinase DDB_G0292550 n=1 Tax=Pecten maximus TaxID=6579 RepID=UPI0014590066|nr:probable cyclin-dependent serine/threonine-protein kinase DDB_G0292550 [Pecten maximus]
MENQRAQYGQDRMKNSSMISKMLFENPCVSQVSLPDSRVNNQSMSQMYQGSSSVTDRTRRGSHVLTEPIIPPQTWSSSDMMPTACSQSSWKQGQLSSVSTVQSRTLGNVDCELSQTNNTLQSSPYSVGQVTSHSGASQYQTNTSSRHGMNENYTSAEPQGFSKQVGYMGCLINNGLSVDTATSNNFGSRVNVGPFNKMGAHAPMPFQNNNFGSQSMLGPQCNNTTAPHSMLGPAGTSQQYRNVVGPHNNSNSHGTSIQSMLGLHSDNNEGLGPRNTLQQSTRRPSNTTGLHNTSNPHGTSKTKLNSASGQQQSSSAAPSNPVTNISGSHDKFSPSVQESFWVSLGDKIHNEADAYQMFIMGQMMQRKAVEWFRDTLQETRHAMEKMDKDHKEEMRKRKESEENVTKRFNSFKTLVETFTRKQNDIS